MWNYISTKYVSAELKHRLTARFPGVKFSVRCGHGTDSAWIDASWTDGPTYDEVREVSNPMKATKYDGYNSDQSPNLVTVTINRERVTGDPVVEGISLHRKISDEVHAEATALWTEANDGAEPGGMTPAFACEGEVISEGHASLQVTEIADRIVLPRRWAATQQAAALAMPEPAAPVAPAPAPLFAEGIAVRHTDADGITATGTRRGDGSAPVLKAEGFKWHRASGYWYLPATRGEAGAARLAAVLDALRAGGLFPADPAAIEEAPATVEELPAIEPAPVPAEEAAPIEELPADEEAPTPVEKRPALALVPQPPAAEEPTEQKRPSLESGAHHIFNTGQGIGGPGMAYAFECTVCHQRARLVEFDGLPCTEEAETAFLLVVAARLLDDVMLREATAFQVVSSLPDAAPVQTREEATRFLAAQLQYGASHQWYEGELRLARRGRTTAYIKPAPAPQPAASTAPEVYRGVPVPPDAATWGGERLMAWCAGADAALAYAFPPAPGE